MINLNKDLVTECGFEAKYYWYDENLIHGYFINQHGARVLHCWHRDGSSYWSTIRDFDLHNKTRKVDAFIPIYQVDGTLVPGSFLSDTLEGCQKVVSGDSTLFSISKITIVEGENLEPTIEEP